MVSYLQVAVVERNVRRAHTVLTEAWLSASTAARVLRRQGQAGVVGSRERELRLGSQRQYPVMLVHGLGADKSCFSVMESHLNRAGYTVYCVSYSCLGSDIEACARNLEREAAWLLEQTGSDRVHVVAHSLGGVVLRWAAANTGMGDWLSVGVTLGSPHRGTPTAHLAPSRLPGFGRILSQLRPGALMIDDVGLERAAGARWVAIAGENDMVVPRRYARLPQSRTVRNAVVPGAGHMTLTRSADSLAIILEELAAASAVVPLSISAHRRSIDPDHPSMCA
jgi:triacylglycerol lipase